MENNIPAGCAVIPIHKPGVMEKFFFLLSGMIMSVPFALLIGSFASRFLGNNLPPFMTQFFAIVLIAPVLEEFAKAYPLFYRHGETERSIFSLGFYAGLGFGIVEFFFYVFLFNAPVAPRILAVLFHSSSASIVAYGISKKMPLVFYLIAVALHFSNNFAAVSGAPWFYASIGVTVLTIFLSLFLRSKTSPDKVIAY